MFRYLIIFTFSALFSINVWSNLSSKLIAIVTHHEGHKKLENHPFLTILKQNEYTKEQLAQFFIDRIYILQFLEFSLLEEYNHVMQDYQKIFYRSFAYKIELNRLMGKWIIRPVSSGAKSYVEYLKEVERPSLAIHLWLFLLGETFGAQHMAIYFKNLFPDIGDAFSNFENMKLIKVRKFYNKWIENYIKEDDFTVVNQDITMAFEYLLKTFNDAHLAKEANLFDKINMTLSAKMYNWTGY